MLFGLGAALGWGTADLLAAVVTRRLGVLVTLFIAQLTGLTLLGILVVVRTPGVPHPNLARILLVFACGVLAAFGFLAMYKGLQLGPVALVSPIVGSANGFAAVLAAVVLGEVLQPIVIVGGVLTIAGTVLASTVPRRDTAQGNAGVGYALMALGIFAFALFATGTQAKVLGWFLPMLLWRGGSMVVLVGISLRNGLRDETDERKGLLMVVPVLIGLLDLFGLAAYTRGSQLGLVSIVTAMSACFPLIPVLGGVLLLRERPAARQLGGVALVVAGLVTIGVAS